MPSIFCRFPISVLILSLLSLGLAACGGDEGDITVPGLTVDAVTSTQDFASRTKRPQTVVDSVALSGTFEIGATVEVTQDTANISDRVIAKLPDPAPGQWETEPIVLEPGTNLITVTATDSEDNIHVVRVTLVLVDVLLFAPESAGQNVRAEFRQDVQGVSGDSFLLYKLPDQVNTVPASVSYDPVTFSATLDPDQDLETGAAYKAVLSPAAAKITTTAGDIPETFLDFTIPAAP